MKQCRDISWYAMPSKCCRDLLLITPFPCCVCVADFDAAGSSFEQEPAHVAAALEFSLRPYASTVAGDAMEFALPRILLACSSAFGSGKQVPAMHADGSQCLALRLVSLLLSCLKAQQAAANNLCDSLHNSFLAAEVAMNILQHSTWQERAPAAVQAEPAADNNNGPNGSSSSSGLEPVTGSGRDQDFNQAWWLVVVGRAFCVAGKAMELAASSATDGVAGSAGGGRLLPHHPQQVLKRLSLLVFWLRSQLQLVPNTVLKLKQQLLAKQQELEASVELAFFALEAAGGGDRATAQAWAGFAAPAEALPACWAAGGAGKGSVCCASYAVLLQQRQVHQPQQGIRVAAG